MATLRSLGGRSLTALPPMRSVPEVMSSRPATMRRAVVLPEPDGPTSTISSPSATSRSRSEHRGQAVRVDLAHLFQVHSCHGISSMAIKLVPSIILFRSA